MSVVKNCFFQKTRIFPIPSADRNTLIIDFPNPLYILRCKMWQLKSFNLIIDTIDSSRVKEAFIPNVDVILGAVVAMLLVICAAVFAIFALRY